MLSKVDYEGSRMDKIVQKFTRIGIHVMLLKDTPRDNHYWWEETMLCMLEQAEFCGIEENNA